ncbi:MAG: leucine-rich repeat domain-containing protein, partial [Rikenellaceae bacterium]
MKRFFAIFSLCAVLALSGCKKDDPAIVDELEDLVEVGELVEFSDSNFKQALITSGYDLNRDGEISVEEALKVTEIIVTGEKIKSLAGLEYFENLEVLQCSDTFLTEIDPFQNTKLREIVCNGTEVTVLDVMECPDIETIYADTVMVIFVKTADQEESVKISAADGCKIFVGDETYSFPDENFRLALLSSKNNIDIYPTDGEISMAEVRMATAIDITPDVATSFTNSLIYNVNSISSISSAETKSTDGTESAESTEAATTPKVTISTSENNLVLASAAVTRATGSGAGYVTSMKLDDFVNVTSLKTSGNNNLTYVDMSNNPKIEEVELPASITVVVLSEVQHALESFVELITEAVVAAVSQNEDVAVEDVVIASTAEGIFDKIDIDDATKSAIEDYLINNIKDDKDEDVVNGYDTNGDGVISYGESGSIKSLKLDDNANCTISGVNTALKLFTNLETLSFKQSTSAKDELVVMYNPLLKSLTMQAPNVSLLNLTNNTALTSVDTQNATGVTALNLSYVTALSSLDITGMEKLTFFGLGEVKQSLFEAAYDELKKGSNSTLATLGVSKISDVSSSLDLSTLGEFTALSYVAIPDAKEVTASQWQIDNYTSTWSLASDAVISLDMDQPMVFADTEFSAYAKALTEADGDSKLTPAEAKTVTSIDFKSEAYSAFAATAIVELKYFTGLTSLNLNGQSTFASTPDFSAEPYEGLTYLNISGTSVSEMDLTKTTLLKELYCTTDGIKSLNVSTNADLAVLEAESVKTLTVSQGQYDGTERDSWKLADGCVFETPELLPTDGLTFSSEVFKQYLITNNAIDTTDDDVITVAEAAAATAIDLSNLGSEDLATITKLSELRYFTGLTSLNLSGCTGLTAVDLTPCTLLTSVDLTDTKVTSLDISKIVNPTNITAPTVTTVAVSAAQYNLKDTTYAETWKFDAAVVYEVDGNLYKNVTFIEGEDETNNRAYVEALIAANEGLDSNKDNVVMESEVEEYAGVLTLPTAYTETDLTEIPQLAAFVKITGVVADSSTITSVDLSANTAVATLSLTNTSALSSLTTGTAMTSLTIGDGSALTTLDLSLSTLLTSIEITGATTLAELDLSACTALTSIEITGATTLAVLDLSACTALTSIEITGATTLASVTLPAASLTTLILDGNTSLTTVDLRSLTTLPAASSFSANASTKLYITGTQAAAVTPSEYLEKLAAAATAIYPTYDATTGTLTVVCDSTGDYEVDSYGVATTGDLLVQINGFDEVKSLYDNGVIEKLVISGVINHGDIRTALNHFYEMDFREVTNLYGKYMSSDSAASGTDKALNTNWPFKPFGDETLMKRITLSAYITTYANQAVGSCASVEEITIPAKATDIKWGAFTTCSMLNKVTYEEPAVVTILSGSTFKTSTLLKEVTLPSSLVTMGSMEFQNSGLTSIEIPAGVTTIGASCFDGCTDLTEVKVNWTNADATFTFTTPETFFPSNFHIGGDNYITIPDDYAGDAYEELALTYQMKTESGGQYYPAAYGFTNEAFAAAVKAVIEDPYQWTEAALAAMTELDLSGYADIANVTDATDLAVFVALETLNLSGAGISELDLSDNTALTSLTISNMASLATLDISMLDGLAVTAITAESSALTYITMTETQYNADATAAQALLKSGSDTSYIYTDGGDQLYPSTDSNIVFSNDFAASESYTYDAAAEAKELTVTAGSSLDDLKWFTSLETLTIESGVTAEEINLEDHNSLETLTISATGITTLDISATQIDEASSLSATYVMTLYTSSTNQGIDDSNYTEWLADTVLATDAVIYVDSAYAYPFKPYSEIDDERAAIAAKITGFMIGDTSYGASDLDTELKSNVLDEVVSLSLDGDLTDTQIAMVVSDFTALTTLSIANNSSMTALNVASLSLTEIEVTGCTSLESVTLESDAVFTTLKFSGNTALTTLDLSTLGAPLPAVANFNADSVTTLTISEAQAMSDENYALYHAELAADAKIYVSGDSIAVYPIAMYSEDNSAITAVITGFTLSGEAQTDVDLITVKNLGEVTALTLEGDLANSYVGQIFTDFVNLTSIVMTGNTTVTAIDMSTTKITSVEITGATALTSLILADGADMTKLEVTGCTELTTLNLRNISTLPEVDNFSATSVTTLEITGAQVTALGGDAAVLTDKLAADAKIDVEGVVQPPMVDGEIWISNEYLQSVIKATSGFSDKISDSGVMTATDAATVTTLVLSEITDETGLNDDLKYLTGLTSFTASGTSTTYGTALTSLDFSNNTSLTTLAMAYQT